MTHTPVLDIGPLQQVSANPSGQRWTLTFARTFPHPMAALWWALTDPAELPQWAPYTADRNLGSIGPATLTMVDGPEPAELDGTVTVVEPTSVLEHAWGSDVLRWELTTVTDGTQLVLRQTTDRNDQLPLLAAGWHICLAVADRLLAGSPFGPVVGNDATAHGWERLRDDYQRILGDH